MIQIFLEVFMSHKTHVTVMEVGFPFRFISFHSLLNFSPKKYLFLKAVVNFIDQMERAYGQLC